VSRSGRQGRTRRAAALAGDPAFDGDDGAEGWFVDGVNNDLAAIVATWTGVKVIGRGTMATYRGRNADPRTVGRRTRRAPCRDRRARRDGERVRLAVSLVDARSGHVAWSELRDVPRAELPALVGDIAGGIARTLTVEYGDAVADDARRLAPHQVQAEDLALQGMPNCCAPSRARAGSARAACSKPPSRSIRTACAAWAACRWPTPTSCYGTGRPIAGPRSPAPKRPRRV